MLQLLDLWGKNPKYPWKGGSSLGHEASPGFFGVGITLGPAGKETRTSFSTWSCHYTNKIFRNSIVEQNKNTLLDTYYSTF
jgi:hypothetical protein